MAKKTSSAAVEEIIAQAMDQHMLEQVSSINLSGVIDTDSTLPTSLETRFRKLKSFPGPNPKTPSLNSQFQDIPMSPNPLKSVPISPPVEKTSPQPEFSSSKNDPVCEEFDGLKPKSRSRRNGYVSSPSSSSESSVEVASPPRQVLCFWCSPKKVSRKKSKEKEKENRLDGLGCGKNDEFLLSDLSTFSMKEQKKKMKRALKEQEKISRDAEQMVSWAKQLSARIDDFVVHDDSCSEDDERFK